MLTIRFLITAKSFFKCFSVLIVLFLVVVFVFVLHRAVILEMFISPIDV